MSKRSPISLEVKLRAVKRCLQNETNPTYEAARLGVDRHTITDWIRKYEVDGYEGLKESRGCKTYSEALRLTAIMDVLSGKHSIREATKKYHISSKSVLTRWISKYTSGEEMKTTRKGKGLSGGKLY
ncbi:Transposase [compost metagenome]